MDLSSWGRVASLDGIVWARADEFQTLGCAIAFAAPEARQKRLVETAAAETGIDHVALHRRNPIH
jgi:hypothetical protein